jgi:phosphonate transport system substrate-binding protein
MKFLQIILLFTILVSCNKIKSLFGPGIGTEETPISFYFPKPQGENQPIPDFSPLTEFLNKETGLYFKITVPKSSTGIDDGFYNNIVDGALIPPLKYLDLNNDYKVKPYLKIIREGKDYYKSEFIIHKDNEETIKDLSDLKDRILAFTNHDSASGYIIPHEILYIRKIAPKDVLFAFSHANVVRLVYNKEVDAGVTFHQDQLDSGVIKDGRALLLNEHPDVAEKVKILYVSGKIPNDPLVFKKDFPEKIAQQISEAILKFVKTKEGGDLFSRTYNIDGFSKTSDYDFEDLRGLMKEYFD